MPDLFERLVLLKQSPVFAKVSTHDLRHVARAMEEQRFLAGDRIFEVNEQGDHLYLLVSGKIGLTLSPGTQDKNYFATLGAGDILGEMNLLDDLPRSATAHVVEDTTVLTLEKTRLKGLIQSYPEISIGMLRSLSLRLREVNARLAGRKQ